MKAVPPISQGGHMNSDALLGAFENRLFVYGFLWRAVAARADRTMLGLCASSDAREQFLLFGQDDCDLVATFDAVAIRAVCAAGDADQIDGLSDEFTRLFVGPEKSPAPAWESVYTSPDELLFQQSTLEVRAAYDAAGFRFAGYPKQPDDALSTELDFMRASCEAGIDCIKQGDVDQAIVLLKHQRLFLQEHLNRWLPAFSRRLGAAEGFQESFYALMAQLTCRVCAADGSIIDELLEV